MAIPFQYLARFPLLEDLPQEVLLALSESLVERSFARREVVLSKEQSTHELGFLVEGRLQGVDFTVDGRGVGLYFVDSGDFFGELSVVDGLRPAEHVVAAARSVAVFLPGKAARSLLFDHAVIAQTAYDASSPARSALARPATTGGGLAADPAPTHQELAIMINSSRETVTRTFQTLMLHEAIRRDGNSLRLLRPDFLSAIGEGRQEPPKG